MANIYWVFTISRNHRAQLLGVLYLCYWQYGTAQGSPGDTLDKWIFRSYPDLLNQNSGGEGDNRGRDGWTASSTQWSWVWASSRRWWGTGRPGVLQSMESQRVGHDWATELNWRSPNQSEFKSQTGCWLGLSLACGFNSQYVVNGFKGTMKFK